MGSEYNDMNNKDSRNVVNALKSLTSPKVAVLLKIVYNACVLQRNHQTIYANTKQQFHSYTCTTTLSF